MLFESRSDVARVLVEKLAEYADQEWSVLAFSIGGLSLALKVAEGLRLPLDVFGEMGHLNQSHLIWRQVILVDDNGASAVVLQERAQELKERGATQIILALPILSDTVLLELQQVYTHVVSAETTEEQLPLPSNIFRDQTVVSEESAREALGCG